MPTSENETPVSSNWNPELAAAGSFLGNGDRTMSLNDFTLLLTRLHFKSGETQISDQT